MAFGKLRKIWEKIKGVARKVWGGIKKALPFIKPIVTTVANVVSPGSGLIVQKGIETAENIGDQIASGGGAKLLQGFRPMGSFARDGSKTIIPTPVTMANRLQLE
jgi:hypothetical protein